MRSKFSLHRSYSLSILTSLLCALLTIENPVSGWSDEGHLLIATIAKLKLPLPLVEQLEATLSQWNSDFPGTGNLQAAAVWLDHISCRDPSPYCSTFKALDDVQEKRKFGELPKRSHVQQCDWLIQVFRTWHYSTRVLNPQNIELEEIYRFYPLPKTGAEWALSTAYESLKDAGLLPGYSASASNPGESLASSNDHNGRSCNHGGTERRGSPFSLNLHLRMLLHIFGDIHQPMHAGSLFAKGFPDGDEGGNQIPVHHEAHIGNLHQLWDTAGGLFRKAFHEITNEKLEKTALSIMHEFPEDVLLSRYSETPREPDFKAIAEESAEIALRVAYKVQTEAKKRIALGGYRLGRLLENLSHIFTCLDSKKEEPSAVQQQQQQQHLPDKHQQQKEEQQQQNQQQLMKQQQQGDEQLHQRHTYEQRQQGNRQQQIKEEQQQNSDEQQQQGEEQQGQQVSEQQEQQHSQEDRQQQQSLADELQQQPQGNVQQPQQHIYGDEQQPHQRSEPQSQQRPGQQQQDTHQKQQPVPQQLWQATQQQQEQQNQQQQKQQSQQQRQPSGTRSSWRSAAAEGRFSPAAHSQSDDSSSNSNSSGSSNSSQDTSSKDTRSTRNSSSELSIEGVFVASYPEGFAPEGEPSVFEL